MISRNTLLLRQISPNCLQSESVTSDAFLPNRKNQYKLSVYDGDLMQADKAYFHYVQNNSSCGVLAVSQSECGALVLPVVPDPIPFPEHVLIDFSKCVSNGERRRKAKKLRDKATLRGWLYRP